MKAYINDNGILVIDGIEINERVGQEELSGYWLVDREEQIKNLYMWIGEATGSDMANDLYLMKEDLHYLENLNDEFVFSSISTNEYIAKSDNLETFNSICKEILGENDKLKLSVRDIAKEINLYGVDYDFKEKSFSEFLEENGYKIISEDYEDFEYSDCKAYLELEIEKI